MEDNAKELANRVVLLRVAQAVQHHVGLLTILWEHASFLQRVHEVSRQQRLAHARVARHPQQRVVTPLEPPSDGGMLEDPLACTGCDALERLIKLVFIVVWLQYLERSETLGAADGYDEVKESRCVFDKSCNIDEAKAATMIMDIDALRIFSV